MIDRIKSMHMKPDSGSKVLMIAMMYLFAYRQAEGPVLMLDGNLDVMRSVQIVLTVVLGLFHNYAVRECVEGRASAFAGGDAVFFPIWTIFMMVTIRHLLGTVIPYDLIGGMPEAVVFVIGILHMILTYIISLVLGAWLWRLLRSVLQRMEEKCRKYKRVVERVVERVVIGRTTNHRASGTTYHRTSGTTYHRTSGTTNHRTGGTTYYRASEIASFVLEFCREEQQINYSQPERYYRRYMYLQDINKEIYDSIRYRVQTGTEMNGYVDPKVTNDARDILYDRLNDYDRMFNVTFSVQYYDSLIDELNRLSRSSQELWKVGFGSMPSFSMTENEFKLAWAYYWPA